MPVLPEEPEIHERVSPVPAKPPVPGAVLPGPRPAPPRAPRPGPPARAGQPRPPRPGPPSRSPQPDVRLVPASVQNAVERADEAVDQLLELGRRPDSILVLTTGRPHPWQQHELSFGEDGYWAQLTEGGDVFYADTHGADAAPARPLKREVVVLVVNDSTAARVERAVRNALGLAGALLVVCGAPEAVKPFLP